MLSMIHFFVLGNMWCYYILHLLIPPLIMPPFPLQWDVSVVVTVLGSHLSTTASLTGPNSTNITLKHCSPPLNAATSL